MGQKFIYEEKQQFHQSWLWILLIVVAIFPLGIGITVASQEKQSIVGGILFGVLPVMLIGVWIWNTALITKIGEDGIYIKFAWFHRKYKFYAWDSITYCEVKKYDPLGDYGGWGIKPGAYNVSGNMGMLIQFTHRDNLMIGTNKPDELKKALASMGKFKE